MDFLDLRVSLNSERLVCGRTIMPDNDIHMRILAITKISAGHSKHVSWM